MNALMKSVNGVKQFLVEVQVELKKCAWPTRQELKESTVVVIVSMILMGAYVGLSDGVVLQALKVIIK